MPGAAEPLALPFAQAIEHFRGKVNLPTRTWLDIQKGMHARAFVVAGATKNELLADFNAAVRKGLEQGTTLSEFRKDFDNIVARHGWGYKGGRDWRSKVIFQTNLATAYSAGRYAQMTTPAVLKARPYWRYIASSSREKRAEHMAWYNLVLPADDPWWDTHWPPSAWGCKCGVTNHSAREVERLKAEGVDVRTEAPDDGTYEWTNPLTGEAETIPVGVGPGWNYNVGEAAWGRTQALRLMEDNGPWKDISPWGPERYGRPERIPVDAAVARPFQPADTARDTLVEALFSAVGGEGAVFTDPAGDPVMITSAVVDHILQNVKRLDGRESYFPFLRELIEDPYEIWIGFAQSELSGRVALRKKYVKAVKIDKQRLLGMWAVSQDGIWVAGDIFRGKLTGAGNLRKGRMLFGRD